LAARVPQNRSRRLAPLCGFAPPHFAVAGLATQALIRNRKTSVTCYVKRNWG